MIMIFLGRWHARDEVVLELQRGLLLILHHQTIEWYTYASVPNEALFVDGLYAYDLYTRVECCYYEGSA